MTSKLSGYVKWWLVIILYQPGGGGGGGGVVWGGPLFSEFFSIVTTHVSDWMSRLYLAGVKYECDSHNLPGTIANWKINERNFSNPHPWPMRHTCICIWKCISSHWARDKMDAILEAKFSDPFSFAECVVFLFISHWNLLPIIQSK